MSVHVRIRNGMEPDSYSGLGGATEGDIRGAIADIIENPYGVVNVPGGHLRTHEAASPTMSVIVEKGVGYIPNDSYDEFDSDSIKWWEAVVGGIEAERTLVIGANSSGQTRHDLVCIEIDPGTEPDEFASNIATLVIVAGTPGAGVPEVPAFRLPLYSVQVVNGATEIEDEDLTDIRSQLRFAPQFTSPRITNLVTSATPTFNVDTTDQLNITALGEAAAFAAPSGTPSDGRIFVIRIKDDGTARALSFNSAFQAIGCVLPTTTVVGKITYVGGKYDAQAGKFDVLAAQTQF